MNSKLVVLVGLVGLVALPLHDAAADERRGERSSGSSRQTYSEHGSAPSPGGHSYGGLRNGGSGSGYRTHEAGRYGNSAPRHGSGYGSGYGHGDASGRGYGHWNGYGNRSHAGYGYRAGNRWGYGRGDRYGHGWGHGYSSGYLYAPTYGYRTVIAPSYTESCDIDPRVDVDLSDQGYGSGDYDDYDANVSGYQLEEGDGY